ncbi:MAG: hypothetical protein JST48_11875 [Bacteroidetes bacterium]|nr:hypothetical protein [Bacteroidota bacterium]
MKPHLLFIGLLTISLSAYGQYPTDNSFPLPPNFQPRTITVELRPILIQKGKYYFDNRRVKYEDVGFLLMAVHDAKIDRKMKVIRTLKDIRIPLGLLPLLYARQLNQPTSFSAMQDQAYFFLGYLLFLYAFDGARSLVQSSAIKRYNEVVVQPTVSLQPGNGVNVGLNFRF